MPSPFPGMDPYLEGVIWPDVHQSLANEIRYNQPPPPPTLSDEDSTWLATLVGWEQESSNRQGNLP
jgi:hypothetical protein